MRKRDELLELNAASDTGLTRIPPVRVFLDTEFTNLSPDARLISIGLVSESGEQSFYAELSDTYRLEDVNDFARSAVLPLLEGGGVCMTMDELGQRLAAWIEAFTEPVILATDSLAWDWLWIQRIFHERERWPQNLRDHALLLTMNYLTHYDQFEPGVEAAFKSGLRRHHTLDDAKANRQGWILAGGDIEGAV